MLATDASHSCCPAIINRRQDFNQTLLLRHLPATVGHWSLTYGMLCNKRQVDCMAFAPTTVKCPTYFQFHIQRGKTLLLKSASLVAYQQSARSTSLEEPGVHCHRLRRLSSGTEVHQLSFLRDNSLFPTQCRQALKNFTFTFAVVIHHKKTKSSTANFEAVQVESDQLDFQRK